MPSLFPCGISKLCCKTTNHAILITFYRYDAFYQHHVPLPNAGKLLTMRDNQMLLRNETKHRTSVDCCPTVLEMVEPKGGTNQDDKYVELYTDSVTKQRFYELSCHKDIVDKPCRFVSNTSTNYSSSIHHVLPFRRTKKKYFAMF